MANLSYKITISSTGEVSVVPNTVIQKRYVGFRCLHQQEGGYPNPDGMPVVRPSFDAPAIPFTEPMQLLAFKMNAFNPLFTGGKFRSTYNYWRAFNNGNGFQNPADPRADYVNRLSLDKPLPKMMKAIICGGMFIRGEVVGNELVCRPGVHGIDVSKPMPTIAEVMEKNWYFVATTANQRGDGTWVVNNFPQGGGQNVLIPYFLKEPVKYPLSWFERWDESFLPDPLSYYL